MTDSDTATGPVPRFEQDSPVVVLIRPQMGENIGAAARAMLNFGLTRMALVAPRDGWPNPRAVATASGAGRVLDGARLFATAEEALADCHLVLATTARPRELTKPVLTPQQAASRARAAAARGQRVGLVFGPERAGLENAEVALADAIVSVPTNPDFASLNLAQCVLLMAWEWARAEEEPAREAPPPAAGPADPGSRPATLGEVERLYDRLEKALDSRSFFWPEHKAPQMRLSLRNMLGRLPLTEADVRLLHGVIRHLDTRPPGHRPKGRGEA